MVWINRLDKKQGTLSAVFAQTLYLIINVEIFNGIGPYRTLSFAHCLTPYKPKRVFSAAVEVRCLIVFYSLVLFVIIIHTCFSLTIVNGLVLSFDRRDYCLWGDFYLYLRFFFGSFIETKPTKTI